MKLKIITMLFLLSVSLFSVSAFAGNAGAGYLKTIHFFRTGVVLFYTTGERSDIPDCSINQPQRFALDASTPGGRVQLTGLLSAYNSGKRVVIIGLGNCSIYSDTETINYFYTVDN